MLIGPNGKRRHFFGEDDEFPDYAAHLLGQYEKTCLKAERTARNAASTGLRKNILAAQHWETVTSVLETCLWCLRDNEDHDLPEPPAFDGV